MRPALPDSSLPVTLIRRPRKTIGIRVTAAGVELVAHPRVSLSALQHILTEKRDWILKHHQRLLAEVRPAETCPSSVCIAGEALPLQALAGVRRVARLGDGVVELAGVALDDREGVSLVVSRLLKREAERRFAGQLGRFLPLLSRKPAGLVLSSARTRWGSCTAEGVIRLNWRLIQVPSAVLDYVIAHELAHLQHMNHSPAFWAETARLCADWQARRRWLRDNGHRLFDFG